ncbi:unnamed protein product [Mytilus edulis]|uniref:Vertnin n=1 Tax=Mytilus edulis TaxID=6550 RepID=A0A8S3V234_MYTED|nr:unnamed protein product [Mytilus edulis]
MEAESVDSQDGRKQKKHRSTIWREQLKKNNPQKYKQYLEKQKEHSKTNRQKLKSIRLKKNKTPEEEQVCKNILENLRMRQAKLRQRKKEKTETPIKVKIGSNKNTKSKPSTRKNVQTKREKWRVAKAKYRANTSNYKKRWVKEKDKNRKKTTKDDEKKMQLPKLKQKTEKSHDMIGYKTKQSLWNKASSVRQQLPTTPRKFVDLLTHIIKNTTPRKKDAIYEQLIQKEKKYASIFMRRNMAFTKDLLDRNTLRYLKSYDRKNIVRKALKNLKIQPRKTRKDKFSKTKENLVKSFFLRTARVLPQKRYTTKYGPGYSLQMTLTAAFKTFRDENPTIKLSFSKFISLKPKCVRLLTKTQWNVCVCPTCFNIKYKLTCLNRAFSHHKSPRNEKELVNFLLCRKPDARRFHQSKCIYGICEMCSSHEKHCNIVQHYRDLNTDQEQIRKLSWNHWERKMGSDGKIRKCLVQKEGNVHQCLEELQEDVEKPTQGTSLVKHVFTADWQQFQFNTIKDNLPKDNILMVMDFGRNRVVRYQDEIKSAYFAAAQITIHPIVLFYHSNDVPELIVRHSLVFLSDDITHDSKAVEYFQNKTLEFLDEKSIPYKELIIFSDGCAGQYKSRHTFAKLAQENVVIQRHYFGSEHGKSESDGEVAAVNKAVDSVVIGRRAIITNATDMYNWCCEHIVFDEPGSKRDFFLVDKNIIEHSKEDTVKPIKGIRQIHQVNNDPQTQGALNIKKVSCFCEQCLKRDYERCINSDYTDIERIKIQNEGKDVKESKRKTIIQGNKNSENKENAKLKVKEKKTTIKKKKETASSKPKVPVVPQEKKTAIKKKKETASSKPKVPVVPQEKKTSIRKKNETVSSKPKVVKQSVPLRTAEQQQPPNEHTAIDRKQYFDLKLQELQRCADYDILLALCTQLDEEFKQIEIVINEDTNIVSNNLVVDRDASNLFPKLRLQTTKFVNYLPVVVYGDGNCLPRSISTLVFGNENNFKEIRARITVEMCINAELYLKNENLIKGNSFPKKDASYLLNTYIMFLEQYTPGDRLTRNVIRRLYEEEVLNSCKNGSWMGIWELLAVSSVLKCEIMSVYPDVHTDVVPRTVLHRRILPLKEQEGLYSISAAVMWSSTRNDGFINHFVPLLPLHRQESHSVNTEPLICFDDSDTSLNEDDSFIKTFLENDVFMNIDNSDIDVMSEVLSSQANIVDEKSEVKSDDVVKSMPIEFEVVCRQANIGDEKSEVKSDDVVKFEVLSSQANIGDEKSEVKSDDVVKSVPVKFEVLSSQANIGDEKSEVKSDDVVKSVPVKFEVLSSQANIGDEKSKVKSDDVVKSVPVKFEVLSSQANIGDEKSAVKSDDVVKSVPVKFEVLSSQANIVNEKSEVKSDDVVKSVPVKFEVLSSQANIGDEKSVVKSDDVVKSVPVKFEVLSSQANIGDEKSEVKSDDEVKVVPVKSEVLCSQANIGDEKSEVKSDDEVKSDVDVMDNSALETTVAEKSRCLNGHGFFIMHLLDVIEGGRREH